ncbi:vinorine synthase-like [Melia azedarach]|uniref:Vinorine synthase-like n=1 Tax=Melia azedarach TaxID=155640 RepID=A0ACC1XU18_MELAZ|nr:vinorine synthase-like [Melia azedarach]
MIFYYPFKQDNKNLPNLIASERLQLLKKSLSESLSCFYPFAGKLRDNLSVDCNDDGIYFVQARVKSSLDEFLDKLDLRSIYKFVPVGPTESSGSISGLHVGKIQVTIFACGGFVICACVSHLFGDGITLSSFMKTWAATACGSINDNEGVFANTDASVLFPHSNEIPENLSPVGMNAPFVKSGRFVTQRFVFDAKAIAKLKAKASRSSFVQNPTRVEVVSAIFSKSFKSGNPHKPVLLITHAVNLRKKSKPPMSEYSMGNIIWTANTSCTNDEELGALVRQLREATMKYDGDFVNSLQGEKGFLNFCEVLKDEGEACSSASDRLIFSSWCNFGLYEVDFGWGKPIWVSNVGIYGRIPKLSNIIVLMDTRFRDGIEAWVKMVEEDVKILEFDEELLAFAKLNPSPLE